MTARALWLPAALAGALALGTATDAQADPIVRAGAVFHGGRIHVGGNVGFPIGHHGGYYRDVVEYTGGHYATRTREVTVPGEQIGWDMHGHPLYGPSRVELQTYQEWVPQRRIVRRVWVPHRARGFVTIGGRWRIR